jgi:hypothetical protein
VNIWLEGGKATKHSRNVIGSITSAAYDPLIKKIRITASLWRHYFPETVNSLLSLFRSGELETSAEISFNDWDEEALSDGGKHIFPKDGAFIGLGLVGRGADPRNQVIALLSAAFEKDSEVLSSIQEKSMASMQPINVPVNFTLIPSFWSGTGGIVPTTTTATDSTTYTVIRTDEAQNTIELESEEAEPVSRMDADDNGEADMPTDVVAESAEELVEASAESPSEDPQEDWKGKYEELAAKVAADEAATAQATLVTERLSELELIKPLEQGTKDKYSKFLGTMAEDDFTAMKEFLSAALEPAGGIASDAEVEPAKDVDSGDAEIEAHLEQWRKEAIEYVSGTQNKREF